MSTTPKDEAASLAHPGYVLRNALEARGVKQKDFARELGVQPSHLSEFIKGKRRATEAFAAKLESALGIAASQWLDMQSEYDCEAIRAKVRDKENHAAGLALAEYDAVFKMSAVFKYVGLAAASPCEKLAFCKSTLRLGTPAAALRQCAGCFHRSEKTGLDRRMIATWALLARYEAERRPRPEAAFNRENADELAAKLVAIFHDNHNTLNRVESTLAAYGIRFCIVPKLERASIDGFSFTTDGVPSIVVTKRYDRIDNLAFAVLHEVGHLKLHPRGCEEERINLAYAEEELLTREERAANAYAADALIPAELWDEAPIVKPTPKDIQREYTRWARRHGLNPWIVLGRVSHEVGVYTFVSDEARPIR